MLVLVCTVIAHVMRDNVNVHSGSSTMYARASRMAATVLLMILGLLPDLTPAKTPPAPISTPYTRVPVLRGHGSHEYLRVP